MNCNKWKPSRGGFEARDDRYLLGWFEVGHMVNGVDFHRPGDLWLDHAPTW